MCLAISLHMYTWCEDCLISLANLRLLFFNKLWCLLTSFLSAFPYQVTFGVLYWVLSYMDSALYPINIHHIMAFHPFVKKGRSHVWWHITCIMILLWMNIGFNKNTKKLHNALEHIKQMAAHSLDVWVYTTPLLCTRTHTVCTMSYIMSLHKAKDTSMHVFPNCYLMD